MESVAVEMPMPVDFTAFSQAMNKFSTQYKQVTVGKFNVEAIQAEKQRYEGLQAALSALSGVNVISVTLNASNELEVTMDIKNCRVIFFLADDDAKAIKRIQIVTSEYSWIDTANVIAQSTTTAYPQQQTDLRHAVFLIGAAQESKQLFSKHIGEYRKSVLVQYYPPLKVKMTFRNGLSVTLQASEAYPLIPGGIQVANIMHTSYSAEDSAPLISLQQRANDQGFSQLSELYSFIEANSTHL